MTKQKKGFTLIELVVVMAIIAVLAALMVAALSAARKQSVSTQVTGDTKTYEVALETYASGNTGKYPGMAVANQQVSTITNGLGAILNGTTPKYLTSIPSTTTIWYVSDSTTAGPNGTTYTMVGCPAGVTAINGVTAGAVPGATPCGPAATPSAAIYVATK